MKLCAREDCGATFDGGPRHKRFCSERCQRIDERRRYRDRNMESAVCPNCGLGFKRSKVDGPRMKVYCSTSCQYEARSRDYRSRDDIGQEPIVSDYYAALRADPCVYCGAPSTEIDHIEPRSTGGANHWENYAGICSSCNSSKRNKGLLGFMGWRQAAVAFDGWRLFNGATAGDMSKARASEAERVAVGVGDTRRCDLEKTAGVAVCKKK